jgi:hypothetical protein
VNNECLGRLFRPGRYLDAPVDASDLHTWIASAVSIWTDRFTSTGDIRSVAMNFRKGRKAVRRPRDASAVESAEALESAANENRVENA